VVEAKQWRREKVHCEKNEITPEEEGVARDENGEMSL